MAVYSDIEATFARFVAAFDSNQQALATNVLGHEDLLQDVAAGERFASSFANFSNTKAILDSALATGSLRSTLDIQLEAFMEIIGKPLGLSSAEKIRHLKQYMEDNSKTVKSRNFTFGSPTPNGSNTGDGVILRLTEDEFGNDLEGGFIETKQYRILQDGTDNLNYRNNERGRFYGAPRLNNFAIGDMGASNISTPINVISETSGKLTNASFTSAPNVSGATTIFTGWTVGTPANVTADTTNFFRQNPNVATPVSAKFTGTSTLTQSLRNIPIDPNIPYLLTFVYNRQVGSATGVTFDLTLGGVTKNFTLTGSETGWNRATLDLDANLWPRNWSTDQPAVEIEVTAITGGYLLIDEVILYPMDKIDASYYAVLGGATPFSASTVISGNGKGDLFTWADALVGSDSIINRYVGLIYQDSLPSTTGAPTWSEPTVL